jgi:hypothetical protein
MNSQLLASDYGVTAIPVGMPGGTNYAAGGATIVGHLGKSLAPPVLSQIQAYLADTNNVADPNALYLINAGGGDAQAAPDQSQQGQIDFMLGEAQSLANALGQLHADGARYFVINATAGTLGTTYDNALWSDLSALGVNFLVVNKPVFVSSITPNSAIAQQYGIINTVDPPAGPFTQGNPYNPANGGADINPIPNKIQGSWTYYATQTQPNPQTYLWADDGHLATAGQKAVADYTFEAIQNAVPIPGEKLTATTSLLGSAPNSITSITYQWEASSDNGVIWTPISGATNRNYTVQESDENARLRVQAFVSNDTGQTADAYSAVTPAVLDHPPTVTTPTISGIAQEGQTLTASASSGQSDNPVTYAWYSSADGFTNPIGRGAGYEVQEIDEGNQIEVVATATNDNGFTTSAASAPTASMIDMSPSLTAPVISGIAQEGQTMTATAAVANDSDATVAYQWQANHGTGFVSIAGATGLNYVVQEGDEGATLKLVATSTDTDGLGSTAISGATGVVIDPAPTLSVTVSGTPQEGQNLAAIGIASSADAVISYRWQVLNGTAWKNIAGATSSSYLVTEANEGHQLRVTATSSDADGGGASATSAPTAAVVDVTPALSGTVSGVAQQGQTLTATANAVSDGDGGKIAYQWQAFIGSNWVDIAAATHSTYRATEADEGDQLRVLATFTDDTGQAASATSLPSTPVVDVTPALSVTLSGTAQEGRTLTAHAHVITDGDGGATIYQWQKLIGTTWTNITGATGSTYQVAETDEGYQIRAASGFTDDTGQTASATSVATASVIDINPALSVTISGVAQDGQTLMAAAIANDLDAVVGFQWEQLIGATWTNIAGATGPTYTVAEANEGRRLRAVATSSDSDGSGTSATSTTAPVVDPAPTLTIPNASLFVAAGGSVPLPISVARFDSDDKVSVSIAGLPAFETITDSLDNKSFSGSSVTLTAAEVNSGLTLHSGYGGSGQPVNVLTVTATNTTVGEGATSAAQTVTVTDPPVLGAQVGLLAQYMASSFPSSGDGHWGPLAIDHPAVPLPFLAQPQHA